MTNLLQDGVVWLGGQLKAHAGLTVTYSRGIGSVSLTATASMHTYQLVDTDGIQTTLVSRDYLIHSADLIIDSTAILPRGGDRITETISGVVHTFEVTPLADMKEYDEVDPDRVLLIVHTRRISP